MTVLPMVRGATLAILLMLVPSCQAFAEPAPTSVDAALGGEFTLAPGSTAQLDDNRVTILFRAVSEDSRCPAEVQCYWPGDATVELAATVQGRESEHELHTNPEFATEVTVDGYLIRLTGLRPAATTEGITAEAYRADLVMDRV